MNKRTCCDLSVREDIRGWDNMSDTNSLGSKRCRYYPKTSRWRRRCDPSDLDVRVPCSCYGCDVMKRTGAYSCFKLSPRYWPWFDLLYVDSWKYTFICGLESASDVCLLWSFNEGCMRSPTSRRRQILSSHHNGSWDRYFSNRVSESGTGRCFCSVLTNEKQRQARKKDLRRKRRIYSFLILSDNGLVSDMLSEFILSVIVPRGLYPPIWPDESVAFGHQRATT